MTDLHDIQEPRLRDGVFDRSPSAELQAHAAAFEREAEQREGWVDRLTETALQHSRDAIRFRELAAAFRAAARRVETP